MSHSLAARVPEAINPTANTIPKATNDASILVFVCFIVGTLEVVTYRLFRFQFILDVLLRKR